MAILSLVLGVLASAALALPASGKFLALGLGILTVATGALAYRRGSGQARPRLTAAAAITLGLVAILLGGAKIALTLAAVDRLEQLL
jgi:hypothetical protein